MKRKILFLVNHEIVIYNFRKEIVEKIIEMGDEVYISSPHGKKIEKLIKLGAIHLPIKIKRRSINIFADIILIFNYLKTIKKVKPSIILSFTIKPNIYGGLISRLLKIPIIMNITGLGSSVENNNYFKFIIFFLYKLALKNKNLVFFQNQENIEFMVKHRLIKENYQLLPGSGVNLNLFNFNKYPIDSKIIFLFVGRIMKEKGIDYFLNAAEYIKSKFNNVEFHIVGNFEENYEDKFENLIKRKIINFHGNSDDVRKYYIESHCIINPTYYAEGMSNVLLEASAIGRPIIAFNRSGCKEIIENNRNGFLVETLSQLQLNEVIEKFIALPFESKEKMGIYGRKKIEIEFDRQIVVNAYIKKINEILS
jgi:galacturonosyltransferase